MQRINASVPTPMHAFANSPSAPAATVARRLLVVVFDTDVSVPRHLIQRIVVVITAPVDRSLSCCWLRPGWMERQWMKNSDSGNRAEGLQNGQRDDRESHRAENQSPPRCGVRAASRPNLFVRFGLIYEARRDFSAVESPEGRKLQTAIPNDGLSNDFSDVTKQF